MQAGANELLSRLDTALFTWILSGRLGADQGNLVMSLVAGKAGSSFKAGENINRLAVLEENPAKCV